VLLLYEAREIEEKIARERPQSERETRGEREEERTLNKKERERERSAESAHIVTFLPITASIGKKQNEDPIPAVIPCVRINTPKDFTSNNNCMCVCVGAWVCVSVCVCACVYNERT